ncbi:hypothetical protein Vafri_19932, partial [Volvox africanus]
MDPMAELRMGGSTQLPLEKLRSLSPMTKPSTAPMQMSGSRPWTRRSLRSSLIGPGSWQNLPLMRGFYHAELDKLGFKPSRSDPALFIKKDDKDLVYLLVHVDDMTITSDDVELIRNVKAAIGRAFKVRDLGEAKVFLGMEISRREDGTIKLSQRRYIEELLERHQLVKAKPRATPLPPGSKVLLTRD